ncbi:MAG: hypothetical protein AAF585_06015 [Verrucomicrobiota bacterium]
MPDQKKQLATRPTFPIPQSEIKRRKLRMALSSPITWAPWLPVAGAWTFLDAPPALLFGGALAIAGGLVAYWMKQWLALDSKLVAKLVKESNAAQDEELARRIKDFDKRRHSQLAMTLGNFLVRKQRIEESLHRDGELTDAKKEVETLVDSLCFEVAEQLEKVAWLDQTRLRNQISEEDYSKRRDLAFAEINHAFGTLNETIDNLDTLLNPASGLETLPNESKLSSLSQSLRSELQLAQRVRERLAPEKQETASNFDEEFPELELESE